MDKIPQIYLSGISSKNINNMGGRVAQRVEKDGNMILGNVAFVGNSEDKEYITIGNTTVNLLKADQIKNFLGFTKPDIIVDYAPGSKNWEIYNQFQIPFVLGATNVDVASIIEDTEQKQNYALVASNMGRPIVMLKHALTNIDKQYFEGLSMEVIESHQPGKKDCSGTVKNEIGKILQEKGVKFEITNEKDYSPHENTSLGDLFCIREPESHIGIGVPEEYISSHAYHTYDIKGDQEKLEFIKNALDKWAYDSNESSVSTSVKISNETLNIQHNINGKQIYAKGSIEAIQYILKKKQEKNNQHLYNMVDVFTDEK